MLFDTDKFVLLYKIITQKIDKNKFLLFVCILF